MSVRRRLIKLAIENPSFRAPLLAALREGDYDCSKWALKRNKQGSHLSRMHRLGTDAAVRRLIQKLRSDLDILWDDLDAFSIQESSQIPWAQDMTNVVEVMLERVKLVEEMNNWINRLLGGSEAGRLKRAKEVKITDFQNQAWSRITGEATTKDWKIVYQPRISMRPRQVFGCTCPDHMNRRGRKGPCKHVIALGNYWQEDTSFDGLLGALQSLVKKVGDIRADLWRRSE